MTCGDLQFWAVTTQAPPVAVTTVQKQTESPSEVTTCSLGKNKNQGKERSIW